MYKKWKSVTALGMAALLGCLMPMGTMLAAEENTEAVQESEADPVSDTDESYDGEANLDENENDGDEINADAENTGDEINADAENIDDEVNAYDENAGDEVNAEDEESVGNESNVDDENAGDEVNVDVANVEDVAGDESDVNEGIEVMSETDAPEESDTEEPESLPAPVINITLNGESCKVDGLGGNIDYIYVNNSNPQLEYSASQGEQDLLIYCYLDKFDDIADNAKDGEQLADLWKGPSSPTIDVLSTNKNYVLYVKAVGTDGQIVYARSCGIVVDTTAPEIVGLDEGKVYQEGTTFKVEDANLESVKVNETIVTPDSNGNYQVSANGTSCVIRAIDKAGNEKTCSITVTARTLEENGVISVNGTYSLKEGTSYKLAEGRWQVSGDSTVYQGDSTFYVKKDGDYRFTKR